MSESSLFEKRMDSIIVRILSELPRFRECPASIIRPTAGFNAVFLVRRSGQTIRRADSYRAGENPHHGAFWRKIRRDVAKSSHSRLRLLPRLGEDVEDADGETSIGLSA